MTDEFRAWDRGRFLAATESGWRLWVAFVEAAEERAKEEQTEKVDEDCGV